MSYLKKWLYWLIDKSNKQTRLDTFLIKVNGKSYLKPSWFCPLHGRWWEETNSALNTQNSVLLIFPFSILLRQLESATHLLSLLERHKTISVLTYRTTFITERVQFTLSSSQPQWSLTMQRFSVHICSWSPSWRMIWSWDPAEYDSSFHKILKNTGMQRIQILGSISAFSLDLWNEIWMQAKIRILGLRIRTQTPKSELPQVPQTIEVNVNLFNLQPTQEFRKFSSYIQTHGGVVNSYCIRYSLNSNPDTRLTKKNERLRYRWIWKNCFE
jgi:hypothetical protein